MSESECEVYHPTADIDKKTKHTRKQSVTNNNGKRKSGSSTNLSQTSKKTKTSPIDVFGIRRNNETDTELDDESSSKQPVLSSFFVNRVANGSERRNANTNGEYYVDCKVYKTGDARDTDSMALWKKALVRIKFQTDMDTLQWRKLQDFVRSADKLFEEHPRLFTDK